MDLRNRIGLYGAYFFGMSGIGFTLPYLPLYLSEHGLSERTIGVVSTVAALAGLLQFPVGLWSDRLDQRRPFLVAALTLLAGATLLLPGAARIVELTLLVALFAENGACRATVESLAGALSARLSAPGGIGAAFGALRFWKPIGVVAMALLGGVVAEHCGTGGVLVPVAVAQVAAVGLALLIREPRAKAEAPPPGAERGRLGELLGDRALVAFVAAMVLFHVANAPGGVYLGLFLKRDLAAPPRVLAYAFIISNVCWMAIVRPAGRLADRVGRRPLLIAAWIVMTARLALVAAAQASWQVLAIQVLDGTAQGLFAVLAAAWVTDRLADPRRVGEAQALVGSSLVMGSAVGPTLAGLVLGALGYRGMFALLAGVGAAATVLVVAMVPETLATRSRAGG
jgi:MFS family permease